MGKSGSKILDPDLTERKVFDAAETRNIDRDQLFIIEALCSVLKCLLLSILKNWSEIFLESLEVALVKLATNKWVMARITD